MADFVAVIRRAVDGLTDNSPDMRVKVYEKARGAVRRQLEAMNPRPSDDLVQRQLDKLEAAISSVEDEHAEALPAEEPLVEEPAETAVPFPEPEPESQELAPEPSVEEPVAYARDDAAAEERWAEEPVAPEPAVEEPPVEAPVEEEPVVGHSAGETGFVDEAPEPVAAESDYHRDADEPVSPTVELESEPEPEPEPEHAWSPQQVESEASPAFASSDEGAHPDAADEPVPADNPPFIGLEPMDDPAYDHTAFVEHARTPAHEDEASWHPEQVDPPAPIEASLGMPATSPEWEWTDTQIPPEKEDGLGNEPDLGEPTKAATPDVSAELSPEWTWPEDARSPEPAADPAREPKKPADSAWGDLEDLIGYQPKADEATGPQPAEDGVATTDPAPAAVRSGQRSFRAEPRKRRISVGRIAAVVAALAVIGGAGAAYWLNKDAVDGMVADLTAPPAPAPGAAAPAAGNADAGEDGQAQTPDTQVASADATSTKFTQRLLPDGTEADDGPAPVAGQAASEEGKSVAEQSTEVASTAPVSGPGPDAGAAADGTATTGTPPAATTPGDLAQGATPPAAGTPPATGAAAEQAPIGVTQKMFIYEERLGQSAPTAIDGTVVWSQGEDSPGGDAKAEPVIRAQLNAPSNGLTAQVTIRRNADRSLPASHLVEIVFALPPTFEGGNIDSVQRVAMKRTEQDRGDPLIAVPAKITEDFHMIALNDFPDAIIRNTELLKTRDWIDIPITYRNGRRALITLEKGASGAEVFNNVMNAWAALGPAADSQ